MTRDEAEAALHQRLTPEVLAVIEEAARHVGWGADFAELAAFVDACRNIAGLPPTERGEFEPNVYDGENPT